MVGATVRSSSFVRYCTFVPADSTLFIFSFKHQLLTINLAAVRADVFQIPPLNAKPCSLAAMLFDCYRADETQMNFSTKLQQLTPLCSTFARRKPRTSLAKELQNLRFFSAVVHQFGNRTKYLATVKNSTPYAHPPPNENKMRITHLIF